MKSNENLLRLQEIACKKTLSFKDALIYLDCSKSFLYKLTSKAAINFTKPNNGKIYFKKKDLDDWMLQNPRLSVSGLEKQINNFLNKRSDEK